MKIKIFVIFLFALIFMLPLSSYAYTPPTGIPDPGMWGGTHPIECSAPSQPSNWTSDVTGYYYVDNTNRSCNDSGKGNLSIPRCSPPITIPEAGSQKVLIQLAGGPYVNKYNISGIRGTASNPIWIRGTSNASKTEFAPSTNTNAITISNSSYIYFENLYINGLNCSSSTGFWIQEESDHIVLRNSDVMNFSAISTAAAIYVGMTSSNNYLDKVNNYHVFYNLNISKIGLVTWPPPGERIAVKLEYGVDHIWILNSTFTEIGEDGIHIINYHDVYSRGPNDGQPQYIYIGNNMFYRCGEQAIDIKESEHVIISQNTIHGIRAAVDEGWGWDGGGGGQAIVINNEGYNNVAGDQSADYTWILFNKIYDVNTGVSVQSGRHTYIVGNLIYDLVNRASPTNYSYGIYVSKPNATGPNAVTYTVNNTIVNPRQYGSRINATYDIYSANNIIYELESETLYHERTNNVYGTKDVRNELYYDASGVRLSGFTCNDCANNAISTNPLFSNIVNKDYSISLISPAIDMGYNNHDVYNIFETQYGLSIRYDIQGNTRLTGAAWDIGAYEYNSSNVSQKPEPPNNLEARESVSSTN